jgi:hypothetical protein
MVGATPGCRPERRVVDGSHDRHGSRVVPWRAPGRDIGSQAGHGVSRADAIAGLKKPGFRVEREVRDWSGPLWLVLLTR